MADKFSTYPTYRDSGVDWIGKVPSEWVVLATARVSDLTTGERDTQDASEDGAFPFFVRSQAIERINTYSFDGEGVLTSGDGAGVGKIFHHHIGKFEFHQRVYLFHNFRRITGRFFFYFLREHLHLVALAGNAKSTVDSLRRPMLRMFPICLPSLEEQTQIAKFLDYETAKIDALIAKQQQLIALLQEKRQAVISHAVTKGLNPAAPLRDSGVEWLGQVPAHWEVVNLNRIVRTFVDYRGRTPEKTDEGRPLVTAGAVRNGIVDLKRAPQFVSEKTYHMLRQRGVPEAGDLLFTSEAPLGEVAIVDDVEIACAQRIIMFKIDRSRMKPQFIWLYLRSQAGQDEIQTKASGSTAEGIRADRLRRCRVLVPSLDEQAEIVTHVANKLNGFDEILQKVRQQVELLQERRTALIAAAVTGKIDVRGWQPPVANAAAGFDEPHGAKAAVLASDAG